MNGRTRTLLAIAMSTTLLAPVAFAQKAKTEVKAEVKTTGTTAVDTTQGKSQLPLPEKTTQSKPIPEMPEPEAPPPVNTAGTSDPTPADAKDFKEARDPTTPTPQSSQALPPVSQGAANAAAQSDVVQRDLWARLDTDADGRISPTEADAESRFGVDFDSMDSDDDGFVSDAEYRAFAKTDGPQGATNAAAQSSVVQRATWTRLDTDADGRISANEADADAGIDASFTAMDSDGDGFVTDSEFRAHAKATSKP